MPKRPRMKAMPTKPSPAAGKAEVVHSSVYLPSAVYDALREIAYVERVKIHDVIMGGVDAALRRRGYPSVEALKSGKKR